jgi:uncharacterized membrane protein
LFFILIAWPALAPGSGGAVVGALLAAPLALLAWKLRKPGRRTLQAGILLQGLYLLIGVTELIANPGVRPWALAISLASLALCACLLAWLRSGDTPGAG